MKHRLPKEIAVYVDEAIKATDWRQMGAHITPICRECPAHSAAYAEIYPCLDCPLHGLMMDIAALQAQGAKSEQVEEYQRHAKNQ